MVTILLIRAVDLLLSSTWRSSLAIYIAGVITLTSDITNIDCPGNIANLQGWRHNIKLVLTLELHRGLAATGCVRSPN